MAVEARAVNTVGGDVELWLRQQGTGSGDWEEPGGPNWSSWSLRGTDTGHNGVLNQAGYWGFGRRESSGYSASGNLYVYLDNIMIAREIYD